LLSLRRRPPRSFTAADSCHGPRRRESGSHCVS
jgi:hypothetical protein